METFYRVNQHFYVQLGFLQRRVITTAYGLIAHNVQPDHNKT